MSVIDEVAAERARQIAAEGWTPGHDDHHDRGELAIAAACYAVNNPRLHDSIWPWDWMWWKPTTLRRDLVKAAALIVAEIERLDRASTPASAVAGGEA